MAIENRIGKVKNNKKGFLMDFNRDKIAHAILQAAEEVGGLHKNIDPDSIYVRFRQESDQAIAQALTEDVILCLNMQRQYRSPHLAPTLEEIHDVVIDVLCDRGFNSVSSSYSIYREGKRATRMGWLREEDFAGNGYPREILDKRQQWCNNLGIHYIADLNNLIKQGRFAELINLDSNRYEKELEQAVTQFEQKDHTQQLRVMIIAGPSSSGKTTTCKKLCNYLNSKGYQFKMLAVDNYFFPTTEYPRDWFGDMDYELPESIDLQRLNEDLEALMRGKSIHPPLYDFKTGSRTESKELFHLNDREILLLDCLHGLYPPTTSSIDNACKFKVYIETYPGIESEPGIRVKFSDIRVLRRMCRDVRERGYEVQYTLEHWATVRKGEFKGIIPFYRTADVVINGSLLYELPCLRHYLMNHCRSPFSEATLQGYKEHGRMDVYRRGTRVKHLLDLVIQPSDVEMTAIPKNNMIREFIGGYQA